MGPGERRPGALTAPTLRRTVLALLLAGACGSPQRPAVEPASAPAAPPRPPPPDLSIPERTAVFAVDDRVGSTGRWDLWRGTLWPSGAAAVGFYLRAEGRFEHLIPAGTAV